MRKNLGIIFLLVIVACGVVFSTQVLAKERRLPVGTVVFTVDDGKGSSVNISEILWENGRRFPATGFVITSRVNAAGNLTMPEMKNLLKKRRWEFQNHTFDHKYFSQMTDQQVLDSIQRASDNLTSWGFRNITALAPPGGDYGEGEGIINGYRLEDLLEKHTSISICRQGYPQDINDMSTILNDVVTFDPLRVKVFSLRKATVGIDPLNIPEKFYDIIYDAMTEGKLVVFVVHDIGDSKDEYSILPKVFESMVDYVHQKVRERKLKVMTLTQAVKYMKRY